VKFLTIGVRRSAQIAGEKFVENFLHFSLDKLRGVWYNGNSRARERARAVKKEADDRNQQSSV
jgi:hypothetical protein